MTIDEFNKKLEYRYSDAGIDKSLLACIFDTMALYSPRIFEDGKRSDGQEMNAIKPYSTKPFFLYVDEHGNTPGSPQKKQADTFIPFSKEKRQKTGKNGFYAKEYKGGYKEFKKDIGRGDKVNLRLFEELMRDVNAKRILRQGSGYDWVLHRPINQKKKVWLEEKYGAIFNLTKEEKENFLNCLSRRGLKVNQK